MSDHDDEQVRLAQAREAADRTYNDALTALDRAMGPRQELPAPPPGFDERQVSALNESWRLLPEGDLDLGAGWRRRVRGIAWRLIGPVLQRQERFNALLVEHLNRNVEGERANRAAVIALIATLDRHLEVLEAVQSHLIRYLQQITGYVDTRDRHSAGELRGEVGDVRSVADGLTAALNGVTDELRKRLESTLVRVHVATEKLTGVTDKLTGITDRVQTLEDATGERMTGITDRVQTLEDATGERMTGITDRVRTLEDAAGERAAEQEGLSQSVELATAATHALKREIERLRDLPRNPAPAGGSIRSPAAPDLDAYQYVAFENRFRGSREEIAAAQRAYLPYFDGASEVLDVGCGRGEFLQLLHEAGIAARGLDLNAEAVERCRERGFDALRADALEYLCGLDDESLGGLFCAQVVEHLEADYLTRLLGEARRVLRPGARIVLETLNPACWTAFFSAFVRDITHRHPLHPDTLSYFLRASGFVDVQVVYRSPVPDAGRLPRAAVDGVPAETPAGAAVRALAETFNQHVDRLNGLIFAGQDYAAIARRP